MAGARFLTLPHDLFFGLRFSGTACEIKAWVDVSEASELLLLFVVGIEGTYGEINAHRLDWGAHTFWEGVNRRVVSRKSSLALYTVPVLGLNVGIVRLECNGNINARGSGHSYTHDIVVGAVAVEIRHREGQTGDLPVEGELHGDEVRWKDW